MSLAGTFEYLARGIGTRLRNYRKRLYYGTKILLSCGRSRETVRPDQAPASLPMVMISEIQRSGGTLLSQLFDGHEAILSFPHELSWGRPNKYHWPDLPPELSPDAAYKRLIEGWLVEAACDGYFYRAGRGMADERLPFDFDLGLHKALFRKFFDGSRQRGALDAYLSAFFHAWRNGRQTLEGKRFFLAFTPRVNMIEGNLERFYRDYPDGYMISVVRDPMSWYVSMRKHELYLKSDPLEKIMADWKRSVESSLRAVERYGAEKFILILFEELVGAPEKVMEAIAGTVGVRFDPEVMTVPTYNGEPVRSNSSHQASAGNVDKAVLERYRKHLSPEEEEAIRRLEMPELYLRAAALARRSGA